VGWGAQQRARSVVCCRYTVAVREPGWPFGDRPTPRLLWEVWKAGRVMSCEMDTHPLGVEIRTYQTGEFQSSQVFEFTELAEAEAAQRKREFTMDGG